MIFMPKSGKLVAIKGKMAQWIAQANDVKIPSPSQFALMFMGHKDNKTCNNIANFTSKLIYIS